MCIEQMSDDQILEVGAAYEAGVQIRNIETKFGVPAYLIYRIIDDLGVPRRKARHSAPAYNTCARKTPIQRLVAQLKNNYDRGQHEQYKAEKNLVRLRDRNEALRLQIERILPSLQQQIDDLRANVSTDTDYLFAVVSNAFATDSVDRSAKKL